MQKGRFEDARRSLKLFRSNVSQSEIDEEFNDIKENCEEAERVNQNASIKEMLTNPLIRRTLFVGCLLMMFQQLCGINTVMYYSATIIQMSGVNDKSTAVWLSAAVSGTNFVFSFIILFFVEKMNRRVLILSSLAGVIFSLMILAVGFNIGDATSPSIAFRPNNVPLDSKCSLPNNCKDCLKQSCGFCFNKTDFADNLPSFLHPTGSASNFLASKAAYGTCVAKSSNDSKKSGTFFICF